jgi:hypothetical protein
MLRLHFRATYFRQFVSFAVSKSFVDINRPLFLSLEEFISTTTSALALQFPASSWSLNLLKRKASPSTMADSTQSSSSLTDSTSAAQLSPNAADAISSDAQPSSTSESSNAFTQEESKTPISDSVNMTVEELEIALANIKNDSHKMVRSSIAQFLLKRVLRRIPLLIHLYCILL